MWGIQRIVTRQEFDGTPPGGWHPPQRLNVDEALSLLTADGAFARREDDRGVLAAGRFADLVVLREDPRALPADCVAAATVLMTIVNGRVAFEGEQAYPPGDAALRVGRRAAQGREAAGRRRLAARCGAGRRPRAGRDAGAAITRGSR